MAILMNSIEVCSKTDGVERLRVFQDEMKRSSEAVAPNGRRCPMSSCTDIQDPLAHVKSVWTFF